MILEIEQQGAFAVKKAVPEAILIFLTPPTIEELERRLRNRKTESDDVIASRAWPRHVLKQRMLISMITL